MARVDDIEKASEECPNQMFHMCKVKTDELRNCPRSICCGFCPKIFECDNCKHLKDKFEYLKNLKD